jgi:outer membrane protein
MKVWHRMTGVGVMASLVAAATAGGQAPAPPAKREPPAAAQPAPTPPQPAAAPATGTVVTRVAVVDVQRVLARSAAGVSAREQLEREKAVMEKEFDGKRQEIDKLRDELEKKGSLLSTEARQEKQEAYDRKRRDAARLADDLRKELEKKEQALLHKVLQDLSGVVERVAKDKGFALVLERRAGLLYADTTSDLTDDVIRAYDQDAATKVNAPKGKK